MAPTVRCWATKVQLFGCFVRKYRVRPYISIHGKPSICYFFRGFIVKFLRFKLLFAAVTADEVLSICLQ